MWNICHRKCRSHLWSLTRSTEAVFLTIILISELKISYKVSHLWHEFRFLARKYSVYSLATLFTLTLIKLVLMCSLSNSLYCAQWPWLHYLLQQCVNYSHFTICGWYCRSWQECSWSPFLLNNFTSLWKT